MSVRIGQQCRLLQPLYIFSSLRYHSLNSKKREDCDTAVSRAFSFHDWFFCRPPTLSSIWSKTILLHLYRVFLLPANAPAQSPASLSDFRCQSHQRDDALYPHLLYAGFQKMSIGFDGIFFNKQRLAPGETGLCRWNRSGTPYSWYLARLARLMAERMPRRGARLMLWDRPTPQYFLPSR